MAPVSKYNHSNITVGKTVETHASSITTNQPQVPHKCQDFKITYNDFKYKK